MQAITKRVEENIASIAFRECAIIYRFSEALHEYFNMRHLLIFICTLVLLGVMSATANACSCGGPGTPCEGYGSATAVFAGAAVSMRENKRPDPAKREANRDQEEIDVLPRTFRFSVEQPYLGIDGAEIEISTGSGAGDCGYDFKIGQRYLVYAYRYKDQLTTSICTRTKSFERANEDLAFLGNLSSAPRARQSTDKSCAL